jgi:hypothetical protein
MNSPSETYRLALARLHREVFLGRGAHTGRLQLLKPDDYEATHTHIIGSPGYGKSFFLEHLLRMFIQIGIPASLLEPHGDQAWQYLRFLSRIPRLVRDKRIIHFRPGATEIGLNPFAAGLPPSDIASLVLEAFIKIWGAESFNEAPRLERLLRLTFHTLAENRATLSDAFQFLQVRNRALRQTMLAAVRDEEVRGGWADIEELPLSMKHERFESSLNRLQRVAFGSSAVKRLFEEPKNVLDISRMLNRGEVLVGDLSLLPSTEAQSLVGAVLANIVYHTVKHRPAHKRTLSVLALDEFPQFVTSDLARSLDQFRKFAVHLMLAHQRFAQLDDDLRSAVNACAKIKVVFGGLEYADADLLAHELFAHEVRGNRVKYRNWQTKFKPILTRRAVESFSESEADSASDGYGSADSSSWGNGESAGSALSGTDETLTHALNSSYGASSGSSSNHSSGHSTAHGHTISRQWVTEHEKFREESMPAFWTLDEQWHALTSRIMSLEKREALIKVFNQPVLDITTPEVKHFPSRVVRRKRCKASPQNSKTQRNNANPPTIKGTVLESADELPEDFHE